MDTDPIFCIGCILIYQPVAVPVSATIPSLADPPRSHNAAPVDIYEKQITGAKFSKYLLAVGLIVVWYTSRSKRTVVFNPLRMGTVTEGIGIGVDVVVAHLFLLGVAIEIHGLQTEQGEYPRLASVNEMGILLDRK